MDAEYHRQKSKEHYARNKNAYKDRDAKRRAEIKQFIDAYKQAGCILCGESTLECLDFHHTDPNEKEFNIASNRLKDLERVKAEIEKCVVVCANCHRKIHAKLVSLVG